MDRPPKEYAVLLEVSSFKAGAISHSGDDLGTVLACRAGRVGSTWLEKGSSHGAQSNGRSKKLAWLVRDALLRGPLELTVRLMSAAAFLAPESVHGEASYSLDALLGTTTELRLGAADVAVKLTVGEPSLLQERGISPAPGCYRDGSNWFGVEPAPLRPLLREELSSCALWGEAFVPAVTHVAAHLLFAGVSFRRGALGWRSPLEPGPRARGPGGEDVPSHVAGAKPGWGAASEGVTLLAVPQLELPDGSVVNDAHVINTRLLIPALYGGAALTEAARRWEQRIAYDYAPSLWAELGVEDYAALFARAAPGYPWLFTSRASAAVHHAAKHLLLSEAAALRARVGGEATPSSLRQTCAEFRAALGDAPFLGGGEAGCTDVSFYGVNVLLFVTNVGPVRSVMTEAGLLPWWRRMEALLPPARALPADAFGPSMQGYTGGWLHEPPQEEPVRVGNRQCVP